MKNFRNKNVHFSLPKIFNTEFSFYFVKFFDRQKNTNAAVSYPHLDVYKRQALSYYSTNDITKKREELDKIISNTALIYKVYDHESYGLETLDKQKYIGLVTTPTTSLKNFKMIETKVNPVTKKIVLIKFKIQPDETNK